MDPVRSVLPSRGNVKLTSDIKVAETPKVVIFT